MAYLKAEEMYKKRIDDVLDALTASDLKDQVTRNRLVSELHYLVKSAAELSIAGRV